jgi:hypothetical protein
LTSQISSSQRRRSSNKRKSSSRSVNSNKRGSYVPLLPELIGIRAGSQWHRQAEILGKGGQIQTKELWTTEALVDELENHIIQVKEEQQPNSSGSSFSFDRKYLNRAVAIIANWAKIEQNNQHHQFVYFLSDIMTNDVRIAAELIDLDRTAHSTISYVLHKVVERLFGLVSASWFYQSASEEIQVRLDP